MNFEFEYSRINPVFSFSVFLWIWVF